MLRNILSLNDFEPIATRRLPRCVFGFIEGGAEDGLALRGNRQAFEEIALMPRVLVDTSARSATVHTLGQTWNEPFGIAPMGAMGVAAYRADLIMAQAAAEAGIPFILSGSSLIAMERIIKVNPDAWFQAYLSHQEEVNTALIARIASCGFKRLVITLDVPVPGNREADIRNGYQSPLRPSWRLAWDGLTHPRWLFGTFLRTLKCEGMPHFTNMAAAPVPMISRHAFRTHRRDNLSWEHLRRLREQWKGHLVIKGILSPSDAACARDLGIDAVIVSNHGGRQLDSALSSIRALPALSREAGSMDMLLDSGVRRGTDVIKALSLGAAQVFIGRPFLYAAAVGGLDGVRHAISLLRTEVHRDLALLGACSVGELRGCSMPRCAADIR